MSLNWDSVHAVAAQLRRAHPEVDLEQVTLSRLYEWALELPEFEDDPALCNDEILQSIYQEWYEVMIHG